MIDFASICYNFIGKKLECRFSLHFPHYSKVFDEIIVITGVSSSGWSFYIQEINNIFTLKKNRVSPWTFHCSLLIILMFFLQKVQTWLKLSFYILQNLNVSSYVCFRLIIVQNVLFLYLAFSYVKLLKSGIFNNTKKKKKVFIPLKLPGVCVYVYWIKKSEFQTYNYIKKIMGSALQMVMDLLREDNSVVFWERMCLSISFSLKLKKIINR